ncbi:MAG: hypothetical protein IPM00_18145 [Tetrasphaera sp.]|nr:hypothetical protein [Tetrasphaera sp.]
MAGGSSLDLHGRLIVVAILTFVIVPRHDKMAGAGGPCARCWCPSRDAGLALQLYYAAVFGAYVALSAWLPSTTSTTSTFPQDGCAAHRDLHLPGAPPLRPVGGWFSDTFGARRVMYWTFAVMLLTTGILMMPNGHIVIAHPDGSQSNHLAYSIGLILRDHRLRPRLRHGCGQGRVYKHIPEYFLAMSAPSAASLGMFGGLGGFVLPPLFAYTKQWSGFPRPPSSSSSSSRWPAWCGCT